MVAADFFFVDAGGGEEVVFEELVFAVPDFAELVLAESVVEELAAAEDEEDAVAADWATAGTKKPKSMRNRVPVRIETAKRRTKTYLQLKIRTHQ